MIFVGRYADGSCGIAEAANEEAARKLFESDEIYFDAENDRIVSIRNLSTPFVSRWFFDQKDGQDTVEIDRLTGGLGERVVEDVLRHEYPMIVVAHETSDQEEPLFDPQADPTTPLVHNPAQLEQMDKWSTNLLRRVRQAIEIELKRFR